jgi:hypothetical protein
MILPYILSVLVLAHVIRHYTERVKGRVSKGENIDSGGAHE